MRGNQVPYYQSVYSIKDNAFLSAEVLCRWDDNGVIISPFEFITELEKMDEIKEVTLSLMSKSFDTLKKTDLVHDFKLSFNFTVNMILDIDFIDKVIDFVRVNKLNNQRLIIELTESENNFLHL